MSALRLAWTELRRITATRGIVVVLLALLLVPTLYGGMYLYANRDPYGSLGNIPAALVVEDAGATAADGTRLTAGHDLATQLISDKTFAWQQVDAATAADGLRSGRYDFAVTVPTGFSSALTTLGSAQSQQATIELTTNDSTSYLARTIATSATEKIRAAVAAKVSAQAASTMLVGFSTIASKLDSASTGATKLVDGATTASAGAASLASGASSLASGTSTLATGADRLAAATAALPTQTQKLADGAAQSAAGAASLATGSASLAQGSQQVTAGLSQLATALHAQLTAAGVPVARVDTAVAQVTALQQGSAQVTSGLGTLTTGAAALSAGTARVRAGTQQLATASTSLATGTAALSAGATKAATGATTLAKGSESLSAGLASLTSGATSLQKGLASGAASVPVVDSSARDAVAADLATPVTVTATNESKASTYGAGLAPFFLVLALWIGAYTLFLLVRPLSRRAIAADQKSWQVALGGWLTPAALGAVQAVLVTLVVSLWVGVAPSNPALTVAFMALVSITFIAIIQALGAWLGPAGQFVALILMILQLVSSGGTFPWQTLPQPLWALHDVLPMSHAIEALRQLFYGGDLSLVWSQLLVLLGYLGGALLLTTLAARRQRTWTPSRLQPAIVL